MVSCVEKHLDAAEAALNSGDADKMASELLELSFCREAKAPDGSHSDFVFGAVMQIFEESVSRPDWKSWDIFQYLITADMLTEQQYDTLLLKVTRLFKDVADDGALFSIAEWLGGCRDRKSLSIIEECYSFPREDRIDAALTLALENFLHAEYSYTADAELRKKAEALLADLRKRISDKGSG